MIMSNEPRPNLITFLLVLSSVLFLILYFPLPFPLQVLGFVAAPLWITGLRRGGKILLLGSPIFVCWISLAYFPVSPRLVGAFVIAYMLGLFIVGVVGYGRLTTTVFRFMKQTRAQLRDTNPRAVPSQPASEPESAGRKRTWEERLVGRFLGV